MAAVARSVRPFTSRMLSQKLPLASACRTSPVTAFPRRSARCFSQSPLSLVKKYTDSHEWIELSDDKKTAKIGISTYAAESLGDVIYVEIPQEPRDISAGDAVGAVESVKSASDVLTPVAGKIIRGNKALEDRAKLINESPEADGWIAEIEVKDPSELDKLLDQKAYKETVAVSK